jgi:hypothetical protein
LEEVAAGRMPSSRRGLRVRVEMLDFVQSPTRFLAAVEVDDALEAMGFFPLPMIAGRIFAGAREREMEMANEKKNGARRTKEYMARVKSSSERGAPVFMLSTWCF